MTLTSDGQYFALQNDAFMADLTEDDVATVHLHAEHHAGGLFVLWRQIDDRWMVKAHDTWGPGAPEEPGDIVVDIYDGDDPDYEGDRVLYFNSGHEALAAFLDARAPAERVSVFYDRAMNVRLYETLHMTVSAEEAAAIRATKDEEERLALLDRLYDADPHAYVSTSNTDAVASDDDCQENLLHLEIDGIEEDA